MGKIIEKIVFKPQARKAEKTNIEVPKLETPISKGKINLEPVKARIATAKPIKSKNKALLFQSFPVKFWGSCLNLVGIANKKIGIEMSVSLSKKGYDEKGVLNDGFFSVWYTCGSKDFREFFKKPLVLSIQSAGMRRIDRKELKALDLSTEFNILFINDKCEPDLISCVKCNEEIVEGEFNYEVIGDKESFYAFQWDSISVEGKGRYEDEDFYFFIQDVK